MNAAQLRRVESKLAEAQEFFLDSAILDPECAVIGNQLRDLIEKVVAKRMRAELKDSRHPFSKRAAL